MKLIIEFEARDLQGRDVVNPLAELARPAEVSDEVSGQLPARGDCGFLAPRFKVSRKA